MDLVFNFFFFSLVDPKDAITFLEKTKEKVSLQILQASNLYIHLYIRVYIYVYKLLSWVFNISV